MENSNSLIYVANAGVLLRINDKKILIDGLCSPDIAMYKTTSPQMYQQIVQGIPPFDKISIMLITHHHNDHFDANRTSEFIKYNPGTVVISTNEVITRIKNKLLNPEDYNLFTLNPTLHSSERINVEGMNIEAFSMRHDGKQYDSINNFAYLIKDTFNILHVGDASATSENYRGLSLSEKGIDLLITPFPYIGLSSARQVIREYIKPQRIAIVHLPQEELDCHGWISATKRSYERIKDNYIPVEFLEEPGTMLYI